MLRKLIKYEFKATSRFMLLMYGLLIALSAIMSVGLALNLDEVMATIGQEFQLGRLILAVLVFMIMAIFVVMSVVVLTGMFFYSISRFKNNLLGNEGYLMHTLPVKTRDNILAKNFVSVVWTILSFVAVGISYFILLLGISETNIFKELLHILSQIDWSADYVREDLIILAEFAVLMLLTIVNTYFHIYASMAVGFSSNTHRIAKSIGVYILISIASNIFEVMLLSPFAIFGIAVDAMLSYNPHIIFWYGIILGIITTGIYYFITHYFMSKKLNLQ